MPEDTGGSVRAPATPILGWDIGGVNTKVVRCTPRAGDEPLLEARSAPYQIQRAPCDLTGTLRRLAEALDCEPGWPHAVTMTAELSQAFRTKRDGVRFITEAMEQAFPGGAIGFYTVGGDFVTGAEARGLPLKVAASNWAATACLVARFVPDCLLVDIGTTSTDIIPIRQGAVAATGWTDPDRLASGELVYTGALRTPAEAVTSVVPLGGRPCAVSADGFALIGDAHLWRGRLAPEDYTVPAPDGRPATREFAGERLARVVCGDREMLDEAAIDAIAEALVEAQLATVAAAIARVRGRHPEIALAVVTGLGEEIAAGAARRAGLDVVPLAGRLGGAARTAPAAAVAWLLAERLGGLAP